MAGTRTETDSFRASVFIDGLVLLAKSSAVMSSACEWW